jgi:hypothetical protein
MDYQQFMNEYQSIINELANFSVAEAQNRDEAEDLHVEFLNIIRPRINDLLQANELLPENQQLSEDDKRWIDDLENAIFEQVNQLFPLPEAQPVAPQPVNGPMNMNINNGNNNANGNGAAGPVAGGGRRRRRRSRRVSKKRSKRSRRSRRRAH